MTSARKRSHGDLRNEIPRLAKEARTLRQAQGRLWGSPQRLKPGFF
jgi:hypothetical protein